MQNFLVGVGVGLWAVFAGWVAVRLSADKDCPPFDHPDAIDCSHCGGVDPSGFGLCDYCWRELGAG
jgi:hypothetical protein